MKRASPWLAAAALQATAIIGFCGLRRPASRIRLPHDAASSLGLAANYPGKPNDSGIFRYRRALPPRYALPTGFAALFGWLALAGLGIGCATPPGAAPQFARYTAASTPAVPGACAWYADPDGSTLYFGESAFWAAHRASGGDPLADLGVHGPKRIGRFDLSQEQMLAPIEVDVSAGSGVWDILALPDRVYFTTFYGPAGFVVPGSDQATLFAPLGPGLNELARGPDEAIIASRYGGGEGGPGAILVLTADGRLLAEHALDAPAGQVAAPKTVAWDPSRREFWATVDLVSRAGDPARPQTLRIGEDGRELQRFEEPEIQFVIFTPDGRGYFAARTGRTLALLSLDPSTAGDPLAVARRIVLDEDFEPALDFVQDMHVAADGRVVATRWSGRIHVVDPDSGSFATVALPRDASDGLYYSAVLFGTRLCATLCAGVEVVCTDAPALGRRPESLR